MGSNDKAQLTANTECSEAKRRVGWSDAAPCDTFLSLTLIKGLKKWREQMARFRLKMHTTKYRLPLYQ